MSENNNNSGEMREDAAPVDNNQSVNVQAEVSHENNIPVEALQAERTERQKLQQELQMLKDHLSLVQMNQQRGQPSQKEEIDTLSDDDVLTVKEAKKLLQRFDQQYSSNIEEIRISQKYPDYKEVITKYLPDVINNNPSLKNSLSRNPDYEMAYYLAKNSEAYKADNKRVKKNADAERIVQNTQRAGSLSSVGQNSPISEARNYRTMSEKDFRELTNKNLGQF